MKTINWRSGTTRAVATFILTFASLWLLFYLLQISFGLEFFADIILIIIGSGWLAYYVWKKTEVGYY